jgi:hypothetical protein
MSVWIPGEGYSRPMTPYDDEMARRRVRAGVPPTELRGPYAVPPVAAPPLAAAPIAVAPLPVVEELLAEAPPEGVEAVADPTPEAVPASSVAFLRARLRNGAVAAAVLADEGANFGFTESKLRAARKKLKLNVFQRERSWWWELR